MIKGFLDETKLLLGLTPEDFEYLRAGGVIRVEEGELNIQIFSGQTNEDMFKRVEDDTGSKVIDGTDLLEVH